MKALLFGSIGTLLETSEIQREAFNRCFADNGLDWHWSRSDYQEMLAVSGGRRRVQKEADRRGESVDANALHHKKTEIFQTMMREGSANPRSGVVESIQMARKKGVRLGLVTSTSPENVNAILSSLGESVRRSNFDVIVDIDQCDEPKPNPDCYQVALKTLDVSASDCLAIEDNVDGVVAAHRAGIICIATPGANTSDHDYGLANEVTSDLAESVRKRLSYPIAVASVAE